MLQNKSIITSHHKKKRKDFKCLIDHHLIQWQVELIILSDLQVDIAILF